MLNENSKEERKEKVLEILATVSFDDEKVCFCFNIKGYKLKLDFIEGSGDTTGTCASKIHFKPLFGTLFSL